jgi:hypothetical protein
MTRRSGLRSAPPASSSQLHSAMTLPAASSAHLDSASMSATFAGPIPLPPLQQAGAAQSVRANAFQVGRQSDGVQRQRTVGPPPLSVRLPAAPDVPWPVARSARAALSVDARKT